MQKGARKMLSKDQEQQHACITSPRRQKGEIPGAPVQPRSKFSNRENNKEDTGYSLLTYTFMHIYA